MKRVLLTLACLLAPMFTAAQVTVTGNLKNLGHANAAGNNTYARFSLKNYGANLPKVVASNVIVSDIQDFKPDANGVISGTIQGNDTIDPGATFYQVCIYFQGNQFRCANYLITGNSFDLDSATPLSTIPSLGPNQLIVQAYNCSVPVPSTTWTCPHNFNDSVVWVEAFNTSNVQIFPDGTDTSNPNTTTITWVSPQAGSARIMHAGSIVITTAQPNAVLQNPISGQVINGPPLAISSNTAFSGPGTACQMNGVLYVGGSITCWPGSDIGAQINAAYAALPSTGGTIVLLPNSTGQSYQYSTPIAFTTRGKPVVLKGTGNAGTINAGLNAGTILEYTPTTNTCAIALDYMDISGSGFSPSQGIRDLALWNNHAFAQGGTGSFASGICMGGTNGGAGQAFFSNIHVIGFGIDFKNNDITTSAWGMYFVNSTFESAMTGVFIGGSENNTFEHCVFANNGTHFVAGGGDTYFHASSFDTHSVAAANLNWTGSGNPSFAEFTDCHFETGQGGVGPTTRFIIGNGNWKLKGGIMEDDMTTATGVHDFYVNAGGSWYVIDGTEFVSSGRPLTGGIIQADGPGNANGTVTLVNWFSSVLTTTIFGALKGNSTIIQQSSFGGGTPFLSQFAQPFSCGWRIGDADFTAPASNCASFRYNDATFNALGFFGTTANKDFRMGWNMGQGSTVWSFRDNTDAFNWFGLDAVNQSILFVKPTDFTETTAPSASAGNDRCYGDSTAHGLKCSYNGGTFYNQTQTVASGTASMTTALIGAGACGTTVVVSASGVTTTDSIKYSYNAAVGANPGVLILNAWPTANNVNFNYCNPTAAGVTPSAATLNWSVTR